MDARDLLLFLALCACSVEDSHQGPNQRRLYTELMKGYNPLVRPVSNDSDILTVEFGLTLRQIMDVDEKKQVLTSNIWLRMTWTDHYLRWDPANYGGVVNVRVPNNLIWKPDILLYNSADEQFDATSHTNIVISPTGSCTFIPPGIFKSICHIDVRWFPFDVQKCELKFGSWTYGGYSLDLKMVEADITDYVANGEWDLVEVLGKKNDQKYECCEEPYPDVTFTLVMRRRTLYYGLNLLIPCVLISTLAMLVFLLPADSGEKISLGITVLLSLTVFMLLVAEIMPATSDSVPLIAQYFATTMVIVGLSVIATVLVLQYHHHDPHGNKMPRWTRVFLLNWCAWFLRMKRPGEERVRPVCKGPRSSLNSTDLTANNDSMACVGMRPLESPHYSSPPTSTDSGVLCGRLPGRAGEEEALLPMGPSSTVGSLEQDITKILEELHYIAKRFRNQDEDEMMSNDWKFAAAVIDRVCLVTFSLITILCTIGIFMSAPNFVEAISKDLFS